MEVVPSLTIYMRDLFLWLKRKKGPITKSKEGQIERGLFQAAKVEGEETLLSRRERKDFVFALNCAWSLQATKESSSPISEASVPKPIVSGLR